MGSNDPPQRVGPYRIEALLGAGGMGEVFRAFDERLERRVALKQIRSERAVDPRARSRFLREARLAARLNHPSLIPVHDILEQDESLWIVMELVEGESLAQRLERGPLELAEALPLVIEVADGLAAIHAAGILHRDLKSENILISTRGEARIVDFGLAKSEDSESTQSSTDGISGTPRSMSPEQARREELGPASDLFALGVLLYEMLRGTPPFRGPGHLETLAQICHGRHEPLLDHLPELPPEVSRLVDRLLAKEPAERPESAEAVRSVLAQLARIHLPADPIDVLPSPLPSRDPQETDGRRPRRTGERRQVTVVCCELVDGGAGDDGDSGDSLDPEVLYEVLPDFQQRIHLALDRYGGYLGDFQGHRAVLCFGYPRGLEDAARRAVLTAYALVEGWARFLDSSPGGDDRLAARAGVHTGSAVVLEQPGSSKRLILGQILDRATALQKQADPGSVLASAETHGVVAGFLAGGSLEDLVSEAFEERPSAVRIGTLEADRSGTSTQAPLAPWTGRGRELDFLVDRFRQACDGVGQAILVTAEAGLGKTRLLAELRDCLRAENPRWLVARGRSYDQHRSLVPVGALLEQALEHGLLDTPGDPSGELAAWIQSLGLPVAEVEPVLAELIGPSRPRTERPGRDWQHSVTITTEVLLEAIEGGEGGLATVAIFEDLQWMDPATRALLEQLAEQAPSVPLLLVATTRPVRVGSAALRGSTTVLHLDPLDDQQSRHLVSGLEGADRLDAEAVRSIVARADGIPAHLEALASPRASDPSGPRLLRVLREILGCELDRLGSAREVAELAAVLGDPFSFEELASLGPFDGESLEVEIGRLVDARVLEPEPESDRRWRFRRRLMREIARDSWLEEDRELLGSLSDLEIAARIDGP